MSAAKRVDTVSRIRKCRRAGAGKQGVRVVAAIVFYAFACVLRAQTASPADSAGRTPGGKAVEGKTSGGKAPVAKPGAVKRVYAGSVDGQYQVRAELGFQADGAVNGTYMYLKQKKPIALKGRFVKGELSLSEYTGGANTGTLECTEAEPGVFSGTWSNPDRSKKLPLVLEEIANDLPEGRNVTGHYENGHGDGISLLYLGNGMVKLQGEATWEGSYEGQINIGQIGGFGTLKNGAVSFRQGDDEHACALAIRAVDGGISVDEEGTCGGLNVSFAGDYRRGSREVLGWYTYRMAADTFRGEDFRKPAAGAGGTGASTGSSARAASMPVAVDLSVCGPKKWTTYNPLTFRPAGWSRDGKFAYVLEREIDGRGGTRFSYVVFDAVQDAVLWNLEDDSFEWDESELADGRTESELAWVKNGPSFQAELRRYGVAAESGTKLEFFPLILGGETFTARVDATPEPGGGDEFDRVKSFTLRVSSDKKGTKTVGSSDELKALSVWVCGFFRSPFESRIVAVAGEERYVFEGTEPSFYLKTTPPLTYD
jgi:hypothetical protein